MVDLNLPGAGGPDEEPKSEIKLPELPDDVLKKMACAFFKQMAIRTEKGHYPGTLLINQGECKPKGNMIPTREFTLARQCTTGLNDEIIMDALVVLRFTHKDSVQKTDLKIN